MRLLLLLFFVFGIFYINENQINTPDNFKIEKNIAIDVEETEFKTVEFQKKPIDDVVHILVEENKINHIQNILSNNLFTSRLKEPPEHLSGS